MKFHELINVIDPDTLVSIEDVGTDRILFCCPFGDLTIGDTKPIRDRTVGLIFPEPYGKYCNRLGLTIFLEKEKKQ